MERTKLAQRTLPPYTKGEEIFNSVTHIVGAVFGFVALLACVIKAAYGHDLWAVAGGVVFGICAICLYSMSSIYHGLKISMAKKVFQVIDHCTIYILVLGTLAPILLTKVREEKPTFCLIYTLAVLIIGIICLTLTAIDYKKFKFVSYGGYFVIGWSTIFAAKQIFSVYPKQFLWWILAGGIVYTSGMIFYALEKKVKYCHSVFHLFCLAGTILHFIGIIVYCM